jgi:hypothetical protein
MAKKNCKNFKKNSKHYSPGLESFKKASFKTQCGRAELIHLGHSLTEQIDIISNALDISARTARRWLSGEAIPHPCAVRLLYQLKQGIPQTGRWAGWRITPDNIITNTGETISPDMIGRLWLWRNEKQTMQARINALNSKVKKLEQESDKGNLAKIHEAARLLHEVAGLGLQLRA